MNPWIILGVLLAIAASGASGYHYGGVHTENKLVREFEAKKLIAVETAVKEANKQASVDNAHNLKQANEIADARVKEARRNVKTIREIKSNTVYLDAACAVPASGLQLIRDAASGGQTDKVSPERSDGETAGSP